MHVRMHQNEGQKSKRERDMSGSEYWPLSNLNLEWKLLPISDANSLISCVNKAIGNAKTSCIARAAAIIHDAFVAAMLEPNTISLHRGRSSGNFVAVSPRCVTCHITTKD